MKQSKEIENKLLNAADLAEVIEICKEYGSEVDEAGAQLILDKAADRKKAGSKELSLDELEAVAGGADRNWPTDGCASTVEADSWCWSNDNCEVWDVTYDHTPSIFNCPACGDILYHWDHDGLTQRYKCKGCGRLYKRNHDCENTLEFIR